MMSEPLQAELAHISVQEKAAVGQMLLLALQHGFYFADLPRLAEKYHTSAAVILPLRNNDYCVNYATGDGFFSRRFNSDTQAREFTAAFNICQ